MRPVLHPRILALGSVWPALASAAEDIRDIRGPKSVLVDSWLLPVVLAGAVVAVMAIAVYFIWRRRRRGGRPRRLSLSEQTLERLDETKPLMRPDSAREFGIATSEVIRTYIEKRFDVVATQRTTEEFLQALLQSSNESLARHRAHLTEFLEHSDVIKFAGGSPAVADLESLLRSARSFVVETGEPPAA